MACTVGSFAIVVVIVGTASSIMMHRHVHTSTTDFYSGEDTPILSKQPLAANEETAPEIPGPKTPKVRQEQQPQRQTLLAIEHNRSTPKIYYCGSPVLDLYVHLFPEHKANAENAIHLPGDRKTPRLNVMQILNASKPNPEDILVIKEWGCTRWTTDFWEEQFPGKVVRFDDEGITQYHHGGPLPARQFMLGFWADNPCQGTMRLTCMAQFFSRHPEMWSTFLPPSSSGAIANKSRNRVINIASNSRENFLIYAQTHIVSEREEAFDRIAMTFPEKIVEYAGRCSGKNSSITNKIPVTGHEGHEFFHFNIDLMKHYRFCLVSTTHSLLPFLDLFS